jgi:hypothetical protein
MRKLQIPRLFAGMAGLIVFSTLVSMGISLKNAGDQPLPSTTPPTVAPVVRIGGDDAPVGTVPIAGAGGADGGTSTTSSTVLGEIIPAPTTTTTPPPATLAPGVPVEMLLVGGNQAQLLGQEFASRLWPMRVRMITGDPIVDAVRLMVPTPTSRVVVYDPQVPANQSDYPTAIAAILAASAPATVLWVEDWRPERGAWRDAVAAALKSSRSASLVPTSALVMKNAWLDPAGGLQDAGRAAVVERVVTAALKPR